MDSDCEMISSTVSCSGVEAVELLYLQSTMPFALVTVAPKSSSSCLILTKVLKESL